MPDSYPEIRLSTVEIDNSGEFTAEESIRDVFGRPRLPDIIVCLNEVNTVSVYQTIVEQNRVGESVILGYYDSDTILKAIDKDVIYATITIDTAQLGHDCIEALNEYRESGYVSEFYLIDASLVSAETLSGASEEGGQKPFDVQFLASDINILGKHIDSLKVYDISYEYTKEDFQKAWESLDYTDTVMAMRPVLEDSIFNPDSIKPEDARRVREARFDQKKFARKEFQDLWRKINQQTYYTVDFKTDDLINRAVIELDAHLQVTEIRIKVVTGTMAEIKSRQQLLEGNAMMVSEAEAESVHELVGEGVKYDLIGKLVEGTGLTRKAVVNILQKIRPKTFNMFKANPEEFIIKACNIINQCKAIAVVEHIQYHRLNQEFDSDIFSAATLKGKLGVNALESQKSLYDIVVVDSKGIEMNFAQDLEVQNEVAVYTKLPGGFYINTPVGHYNPDWAIVFKEGTDIKHIYFVAETKGYRSDEVTDYRETERVKIECAKRHFETISSTSVTYGVVKDYEELRNVITQ